MTTQFQPPRNAGSAPVTTVFLRPSFRITTRDGSLDVAVQAEPNSAQASETSGGPGGSGPEAAGSAGSDGDDTGATDGPRRIASRRTSRPRASA